MLYRDLVQFDPIETVIQLREADRKEEAHHLVRTYVISDPMAERLTGVILPQLRFDRPADNKGILVVGNYGTGKSHLLSVLSAIAEHADLIAALNHPAVASAARDGIAGRFQVLRTEVGYTTMALRDILFDQLEQWLATRGVDFRFPSAASTPNSKDPLIAMLQRFGEQYPDQGLLLVVDELLDYLRSRKEQELILDLNFLRELGEVSRLTRFRFIGGVQESLFDSPRFQFVADTVRRVRDRFEQVRITRTDVAYVVAERLLHKTPEQRGWIHRYLERFAPLYPAMAERLDDFVRLFPIHPAYLEVFERITLVEKREALRTLSRAIASRLDQSVPEDQPGLVSYDDYWAVVQQDPSLRSVPEIREVVEKSQVLEERIRSAYTRPAYRPLALRLIHGLSVLRLAMGEIYAPLGATVPELRDGLTLFIVLPEPDADFLLSTVEVAIKEIVRTVSGQFISFNPENGQYYLDLKKDIDYDALIAEKARVLTAEQMDRYYFDALKRVLEQTDSVYVPGYRIWSHEVPWPGHGVTRAGYLFFGAPNERSTAQPPRDFYLYFVQPYDPPAYDDQQQPDEVFFHLTARDEAFEQALLAFAGAMEMAHISSGEHRQTYLRKADDAVLALQRWLRQQLPSRVTVTYQGTTRALVEWVRTGTAPRSDLSILELVNAVASACLAGYFDDRYPAYPSFRGVREPITETSRARMAQEAVRWLSTMRTQAGTLVLEGLDLLQEGQVRPQNSPYGRHILEQIERLRPGEVLNRSALLISPFPGLEVEPRFRLEPEWVVVLLLALVHSGGMTVQLPGERIDPGTLERAARLPMETLTDFRFVERPRELPLAAWLAVFELLELPAGLIRDTNRHDVAIETLQRQVETEMTRLVRGQEILRQGLLLWQESVLDTTRQTATTGQLAEYKTFLESLRVFNSPGRLRNLRVSENDVRRHAEHRALLNSLERLIATIVALQPSTAYLREAEAVLPGDHELASRIWVQRNNQLTRLRSASAWDDMPQRQELQGELELLRGDYVEHYMVLHSRARLGQNEDERKRRVLASAALRDLRTLATVHLLPTEQLTSRVNDRLGKLVSCWRLVPSDLRQVPVCLHCGFKPALESSTANAAAEIDRVEDELDALLSGWTEMLWAELGRPEVGENLALLERDKQRLVRSFLDQHRLPQPVSEAFVAAVNDALRGVEWLPVPAEDLLLALAGDGTPCSPEVFRERFLQFVAGRLAGHEAIRVRISLDW